MKKELLYITTLASFVLFCGCVRDSDSDPGPAQREVKVELSASLRALGDSRVKGMVNPKDPLLYETLGLGLPPEQLEIGIMTTEWGTTGDAPNVLQWSNTTSYLDRGFFGGNIPGDKPEESQGDDPGAGRADDPITTPLALTAWNGNIEYTDRSGKVIQQVLYRQEGTYYFFVCVYPYESIIIDGNAPDPMIDMLDPDIGATVYFEVNGSQDVMASTMGKGNIDNTVIDPLIFSHKMTALQCKFIAENSVAKDLYGDIISVELMEQPNIVALNIGENANDPATPLTDASTAKISYLPVRSETDNLTLPDTFVEADAKDFGYVLAMPAREYSFKIVTQHRGTIYTSYDFSKQNNPPVPVAGTIYNLTFTMMEAAEIKLAASVVKHWSLDQMYD